MQAWNPKDGLGFDTNLGVVDNVNTISAMRMGKITGG